MVPFMTNGDCSTRPGSAVHLTDDDRELLEFEEQWWQHAGSKETEIRARFGLGSTTYYQRLNRLIDTEPALQAYPMLVRRLRRLRGRRRRPA